MKIANILADSNFEALDEFNLVDSLDLIDNSLPTLIIGWDKTEKYFPDHDITDKIISQEPDIQWVFKKTERRDLFTKGYFEFIDYAYNSLVKDIKYVFVDPIVLPDASILKIKNKIKSFQNLITYIHDDMIYMHDENIIFGVDLKLLRYMDADVELIVNKIKSISSIYITSDDVLKEYTQYIGKLDNNFKYIPVLFKYNNPIVVTQ